MKKHLLFALPILLLCGCAEPAAEALSESSLEEGESRYTATLTADKSTLTSSDSTEAFKVEIASEEDVNVKYEFEISAECYLNTKSSVANQIGVRPGASIKSSSKYEVEKITVDFYGGKGINYQVFNNTDHSGEPLQYHETSITPTDPDDYGTVYDYAINSTGWCLFNHTENNKPSFYYISVVFKK